MSNTERSERHPPVEILIEGASKVEMFEVVFRSEAIAKCVASHFTNVEVTSGCFGFSVKSFLLDRETVLRILRKHHLQADGFYADGFYVDTFWV